MSKCPCLQSYEHSFDFTIPTLNRLNLVNVINNLRTRKLFACFVCLLCVSDHANVFAVFVCVLVHSCMLLCLLFSSEADSGVCAVDAAVVTAALEQVWSRSSHHICAALFRHSLPPAAGAAAATDDVHSRHRVCTLCL